jgi:flavin reductase (DIM6/NTAB) family NADH-FMN oxidoreductase RutF
VHAMSICQCGGNIECRVDKEIRFEDRTWFIGQVVVARKDPEHSGERALLCGRTHYTIADNVIAPR